MLEGELGAETGSGRQLPGRRVAPGPGCGSALWLPGLDRWLGGHLRAEDMSQSFPVPGLRMIRATPVPTPHS